MSCIRTVVLTVACLLAAASAVSAPPARPGPKARPRTCPADKVVIGGHDVAEILEMLGARRDAGATDEQVRSYASHFDRSDPNRDGKHTRAEYVEGGSYMTPQARAGIFGATDNNADGVATRVEYVLNRIITDEAKAIVQRTDADRNGKVTRAEFVTGSPIKDKALAGAVYDALDTSGDAVITVPEYLRVWGGWARPNYMAQEAALAARLARLDGGGKAEDDPPAALLKETKARRDKRMAWWRDARFGMFIHWGLYAVPAGRWEGKPVGGIGEWIMDRANIPLAAYEKLAPRFNPVKFDADAWARTAAEAGMKYVVITSKHHDGFCLFDTKATDYDVVDASPYGRDLLAPLAAACRKRGLKFCTYYSIMDWHHPAQDRGSAKRYNPTKMRPGRKSEYMAFMKQQLKELLDSCDPDVLWFDGEWPAWYAEEDARDVCAYLRKLKPGIIINNRVGKGRKGMEGMSKGDRRYMGDFGTPEQRIPPTGLPGVDWESCMTMNRTWGFKKDDHDWKSTEVLVRNLIDIASKGGNFLLNVGPTAEGLIPPASVTRLGGMGTWLKVNGQAIYGTTASPIGLPAWGRCTRKASTLYLHVFDWPADKLEVAGLRGKVARAHLLAEPDKPLDVAAGGRGMVVSLPAKAPDEIASVVVLEIDGKLVIDASVLPKAKPKPAARGARSGVVKTVPTLIEPAADGTLTLKARSAALHGGTIAYEVGAERDNIGFWTNARDWVSWKVKVPKAGAFAVELTYACDLASADSEYALAVGNATIKGKVKATGSWSTFKTIGLGQARLSAGTHELSIKALAKPRLAVMNVRSIVLSPSK